MPASTTSLTLSVYERLRSDVLACRLRPGQRLRINDLSQDLGVSLSAVREALSRLTAEALVVAEPQRGFRAAPISADELRDLTAVKVEIECMCLRRAIIAGDIAWEERLVSAHHRLTRTAERERDDPDRLGEAWSDAHRNFHSALVAGCDSPCLLEIREMLYARSERYRRLSVPLARAQRNILQEHQEIVDATLARAPDRATALLAAHLEQTSAILLAPELEHAIGNPAHIIKSI